jgi:hypothetical protein
MSGPFLNNAALGQPLDGRAPTPEAFQPVARGREASPRVMRAYGFLPRRGATYTQIQPAERPTPREGWA